MRKQSRAQPSVKSRHVRQRPSSICQVFLLVATANFSFVISQQKLNCSVGRPTVAIWGMDEEEGDNAGENRRAESPPVMSSAWFMSRLHELCEPREDVSRKIKRKLEADLANVFHKFSPNRDCARMRTITIRKQAAGRYLPGPPVNALLQMTCEPHKNLVSPVSPKFLSSI